MAKSMLYTSCTSLSVHLLCRIYPIHAERSDDPMAFDDFIHHRAFRGYWHQIAGFGWLKKNGAEPPHSFASSTVSVNPIFITGTDQRYQSNIFLGSAHIDATIVS